MIAATLEQLFVVAGAGFVCGIVSTLAAVEGLSLWRVRRALAAARRL